MDSSFVHRRPELESAWVMLGPSEVRGFVGGLKESYCIVFGSPLDNRLRPRAHMSDMSLGHVLHL